MSENNYGIYVGTSVEAIKEVSNLIKEILTCSYVDNKTKQIAIKSIHKMLPAPQYTSIANTCVTQNLDPISKKETAE